ncbi:hypothetical protein [Chryseobacterium sp. SIMBA_028]|uniref:hypothetical protein n=1 Tax=Chryseobacterium sp. SIMBA_028 TaxID=3085771 RepID=UPI00397C55C9
MKNTKELYLIIQKKYFLEIIKGEKIEEYRDFVEYYINRLFHTDDEGELTKPKNYETIRFQMGYRKNAPQMVVECEGISIDADEDGSEFYTYENCNFTIHLGKILEKINCENLNN